MKPLNHKLWKVVYLLAIWLGLELGMTLTHAEVTNKQTERPPVEYHWKALQDYNNLMRMRQLLYGKKTKKEKTKLLEVPEPQPSPSQADFEIQRRRHRNRRFRLQPALASLKASSRLARPLWRQNLRGSNRASPQSPQSQRTLYGPDGQMSLRGAA